MDAFDYIVSKQLVWANNRGIDLIGSRGGRGEKLYVSDRNKNLFEPLTKTVIDDFQKGDGGELIGQPAKICALHSSSALGVNIFQYWHNIDNAPTIAAACGFCREDNKCSQKIRFEKKFKIDDRFAHHPNIDVVIENKAGSRYDVFAIECKFSEAYSSHGHSGLKEKYLELDGLWKEMPHLRKFALSISPSDGIFEYLHPAQLVKHILGLTNQIGVGRFRLMYLWYDCLGCAGAKHRQEIEQFTNVVKRDNILFHALSYQELIIRLSSQYRQQHDRYIKYISERYL